MRLICMDELTWAITKACRIDTKAAAGLLAASLRVYAHFDILTF